jgi:hypothetical protein
MASFAPPLMGLGSSIMVIIGLLWKLVATSTGYTNELFSKTLTSTSTSLPVSWSYL